MQVAAAWRAAGAEIEVEIPGSKALYRIFRVRLGPEDSSKPAVVFLHGFPTSSLDWAAVAALLAERGFRLVFFDFLGYGFSDKPRGHRYSLFEQADLTEAIVAREGIERLHLVAHDMGDSVALELARRESFRARLESLTLLNGSVLLAHYRPRIAQRLLRIPLIGAVVARFSNRRFFVRQMTTLFAPARVPAPQILDEMWDMIAYKDGARNYHRLIRYLDERAVHEVAWLEALGRTKIPLVLLWGQEDPVSVPRIAEEVLRYRPDATLVRLAGIGHYPQIEDAGRVAAEIAERVLGLGKHEEPRP